MSKHRRLLSLILSFYFFLAHAVLAYSSETNFWKSRRVAPIQVASVPTTYNPTTIIQNFPALASTNFKSALRSNLPAGHDYSSTVKNILAALATAPVRIQSISPASSAKTVVLIQDVHMNAEAQKNIGQTIESLGRNHVSSFAALEGTNQKIDLSAYHAFPDQVSVKAAAELLFKQGEISG